MSNTFQDRKGQLYSVNIDAIKQLCLAWGHAAGKFRACRLSSTRSGNFFYGERFFHVSFDRNAFNSYKTSEAQRRYSNDYFDPMIRGVRDYRDLVDRLVELRQNTDQKSRIAFQHFDAANRKNRASLNELDKKLSRAKLVRNLSATALVIGAAPLAAASGFGAGVTALSTGSLLKGNAVYQDTGNLGMATVEVACEMCVGMVGVGSAATTTKELVKQGLAASKGGGGALMMLMVEVPMEGAKTVVGGGTLTDGVVAAATKATFGAIDLGGIVDGWSLPVQAKLVAGLGVDTATGTIRGDVHSKSKAKPGSSSVKITKARGAIKVVPGMFLNTAKSHKQYVLANCIRKVG